MATLIDPVARQEFKNAMIQAQIIGSTEFVRKKKLHEKELD